MTQTDEPDPFAEMAARVGVEAWQQLQAERVPADEVIGMTLDDLRQYATEMQALHDPKNQLENGYERCEHCHYTRHPCEVHDLATAVLELLDRG